MNNLDKWLSSHIGKNESKKVDYRFGLFKKKTTPRDQQTNKSPTSGKPNLPAAPAPRSAGKPVRRPIGGNPPAGQQPGHRHKPRFPGRQKPVGFAGQSSRSVKTSSRRGGDWEKPVKYVPPPEIRATLLPDFEPYQPPRISFQPGAAVRIIPIGGLEEIGKNMTVIENEHDLIVIDCGMQFPEEDMFGVDYAIPDVSYIEKNKSKLRAILITHGHMDHIGGLRNLLPRLGNPLVFASRLSCGLISKQLEEYGLDKEARLREFPDGEKLRLGSFTVETFHINHSIPDGRGLIIRTPVGIIMHSGDFKFDKTPPPTDKPTDFKKIMAVGKEGVIALLADSTNASEPGYTKSEQEIGQTLDRIVERASGRLVVAAFSSVIGRLQQLINSALKYNRTIFVSGRSMETNLAIAKKLGYVKFPERAVQKVSNKINDLPPEQVLILSTGSQGEEFSALSRMSTGNHVQVKIHRGDTVVLSSSPIPGNERSIANIKSNLLKLGARVITDDAMAVHTSGHAQQEEIKLLISLVKPKYYIPIHGEFYMRHKNKDLALEVGLQESQVPLVTNGSVVIMKDGKMEVAKEKIEINEIIVDGKGHGMETGRVQEERKIMSKDGVIVLLYKVQQKDRILLGAPKFISRGFVYEEELGELNKKIIKEAKEVYERIASDNSTGKQKELVQIIRNDMTRFIEKMIDRRPIVIPLIVET